MIKYKLKCKKCRLLFDSWFASSLEYEKLRKKNYLNCHKCGSLKVEKTLMAPKFLNKSWKKDINIKDHKYQKINEKIKEYQKFIKKNFEYVGENFAYEARAIHFDNKKKDKAIYGKASLNDFKELKEEGIEVEMVPWIDDKNN